MSQEIPLSGKHGKGKFVIVDDIDYERLAKLKWFYSSSGYATRSGKRILGQKRKRVHMHRIITNCPDGMEVDHINHNPLDNRSENLRVCTHQENTFNKIKKVGAISRYIGVKYHAGRWVSVIRIEGKKTYLGRFRDEIEAAKVYDDAAHYHRGEFAELNFPQKCEKTVKESEAEAEMERLRTLPDVKTETVRSK